MLRSEAVFALRSKVLWLNKCWILPDIPRCPQVQPHHDLQPGGQSWVRARRNSLQEFATWPPGYTGCVEQTRALTYCWIDAALT